MKRKPFATLLICLMSILFLTSCGNATGASDSMLKDIQENAGGSVEEGKTEDPGVPNEEKKTEDHAKAGEELGDKEEKGEETVSAGKSLAQRMAGKYSYYYSDDEGRDEFYIMDVVPFGDNLYAFCGCAMPEDSEKLSAYSFWASEFIPYDADEMTSMDGDTVTVNELRFSVMSNAGMYWDAGYKGNITLTDDGLVFTGFDQEGFLVPDHDDSRLFKKDDRVEDAFSYLKEESAVGSEELQGLWVHDDKDADLYIEFSGSNIYIYSKDPGHEVKYAAGGCDFRDGSFDCVGSTIEYGGMPFEFTCRYKTDGDKLILEDEGESAEDLFSGFEEYRRVPDGRVHVTTMDEVELTFDSFGMFGSGQHHDELGRQEYYGVFVSSARSPEGCTEAINKLDEAGSISGFTVYTPDFTDLNPEPYYTVTTGLYISESDARIALAEAKEAGFTDAYVKNAGSYTGDRYWYMMQGDGKIDMLKDGVMLRGVSLTIPYPAEVEPDTANLLVTKDSVFDGSAEPEAFGNREEGDTPYEWIVKNCSLRNEDPDKYQMNGPALAGVFEVGLEGSRITTYYGSYWWD